MTNFPDRLKTALADRYEIQSEVGEGGMATVYLAHDLRHDRHVALKLLRPELGAVLGAERFLSEIRVTANLQHPHILPLFDSGEADGFLYYVMPYIEGESLRDKLDREKQLPLDEAFEITKAVGSALHYAHRHDVIHRDIKPENILLHDGQALVADFGIALAVSAAGGARITETGLSLGTPHYMSPEQATGDRQIDAKSDIYSLGCVLYEMLAGDPPHTGPTAQAVIAKLLTDKPTTITAVRETVPPHVAAALDKALAKLPADRFRTASEFIEALTNPSFVALPEVPAAPIPLEAAVPPERPGILGDPRLIAVASAAVLATAAAVWGWVRPAPTTPLMRFGVELPSSEGLASVVDRSVAISPDGSRFVFVGLNENALQQLYLRPMNQLEARPIPGTEGASNPFFSPDGDRVGFVHQGTTLKKVAVGGGPALTIAEGTGEIRGASWGTEGSIVFAAGVRTALSTVAAAGGTPEPLTTLDEENGEVSHRWPEFLPGGKAVVFTSGPANPDAARIAVVTLETGEVKFLLEGGSNPHYIPTGHLVYGVTGGSLLAVPFDIAQLEVTGPAFPILDGVVVKTFTGAAEFAFSLNGSLVYLSGTVADRTLVTVDRQGVEQPITEELRLFSAPRFSPDGNQVAMSIEERGTQDIWVLDIQRRTLSRLTFEGDNYYPVWTPDGERVTFSSDRSETRALFSKPADGSGPAELLHSSEYEIWEAFWSPDSKWLAFRESTPEGVRDISVLSLEGERTPRPFLQTEFNERAPAVSPDGRWLAYVSNESGRDEVYVRAFPEPGGRWQVSRDGGQEPAWARSGGELFYRSANKIVAVAVETEPTFKVGTQEELLEGTYMRNPFHTGYDIHPDGDRFVIVKGGEETTGVVVVLNWFEDLREHAGSGGG